MGLWKTRNSALCHAQYPRSALALDMQYRLEVPFIGRRQFRECDDMLPDTLGRRGNFNRRTHMEDVGLGSYVESQRSKAEGQKDVNQAQASPFGLYFRFGV
jgi:hypothetical protein